MYKDPHCHHDYSDNPTCKYIQNKDIYMYLWFKIFLTSLIFISRFVSDYDNDFDTMKNKNQTGLKNFKSKINLNHNIYM